MKLIPNLSEIDRRTIHEFGIPGLTLMERAGEWVAKQVSQILTTSGSEAEGHPTKNQPVLILCGPGNNGGDGFVCARYLYDMGYSHITVLTHSNRYKGDAEVNLTLLPASIKQVHTLTPKLLKDAVVIVDALFGSGLNKVILEPYAQWIEQINKHPQRDQKTVVAVDIPSGVSSATGQVASVAMRADYTVTFATGKPGLYLYPGKEYSGQVSVVDIGIPKRLIEGDSSRLQLLTPERIRANFPKRKAIGHKYSFGHVLVIAGSHTMPGAAALCAEAALTSGAGVVTLAAPKSVFQQIQVIPELLRSPLPENQNGCLTVEALASLDNVLEQCDAVAVGPGLGSDSETVAFIAGLLKRLKKSLVQTVIVDADALNAIAKLEKPPALGPRFILTPHLGEASRLFENRVQSMNSEKSSSDKKIKPGTFKEQDLLTQLYQLAEAYRANIVLKSASTMVMSMDERVFINPTGNNGMATAGSGDVLTGLIAGLAAQGCSASEAARIGVYWHGLAGDYAAEVLTPYCMKAGDITRHCSVALKKMLSY